MLLGHLGWRVVADEGGVLGLGTARPEDLVEGVGEGLVVSACQPVGLDPKRLGRIGVAGLLRLDQRLEASTHLFAGDVLGSRRHFHVSRQLVEHGFWICEEGIGHARAVFREEFTLQLYLELLEIRVCQPTGDAG